MVDNDSSTQSIRLSPSFVVLHSQSCALNQVRISLTLASQRDHKGKSPIKSLQVDAALREIYEKKNLRQQD